MIPLPLAILAAVLAAPLAAQDARIRERLDPTTAASVDSVMQAASRAGLPTEPLVQLALEGQSKGAPGPRIVAAVGRLADGMASARTALGDGASNGELSAGALWLRSGGSVEDLTRFRRAAGQRSLALPLSVGADLLKLGWPGDQAGPALQSLLDARVSDRELMSFSNRVDKLGNAANASPDALRREVSRFTSPGSTGP